MGRRLNRAALPFALLPFWLGCASAASTPPAAAPEAERSPEDHPGALATPPPPADQMLPPDVLYPAHEAVPAPEPSCTVGAPLPERTACTDARAELATALLAPPAQRDEALGALEKCETFPPGLVRALRAELGPPQCADVLVSSVVGQEAATSGHAPSLGQDVRETLVGLGLAARLHRLAGAPPAAPQARDKASLDQYFQGALFPWIEKQAAAIYVMAAQGKELHGYAKGVVAIEAGNADMRFVEIARNAPLAEEIARYPEARDVYYATLDERLEPRKGRGSAAALVGLREMAQVGIRHSDRVAGARALLSRAYGGRRVNALDLLLLPAVPAEKAEDAASTIASHVPSVYATALVGPLVPTDHVVRAHLQMGMPIALRRQIQDGSKGPVARLYLARALFEQGRTYFRAQDFQDAHQLLTVLLDEPSATPGEPAEPSSGLSPAQREEAVLLRALSVALLAGPKDAAQMIAEGPRFADALGNLVLLDGLASTRSAQAGRAAFNAAYLRELVVAPADPEAWKDLAARYAEAGRLLGGAEAKIARDRAKACRDIEKTVRTQLEKPQPSQAGSSGAGPRPAATGSKQN